MLGATHAYVQQAIGALEKIEPLHVGRRLFDAEVFLKLLAPDAIVLEHMKIAIGRRYQPNQAVTHFVHIALGGFWGKPAKSVKCTQQFWNASLRCVAASDNCLSTGDG